MRVVAGRAKGIRLDAVPGERTRPISDRVKESLFNILGDWIIDARVLDLFAGTGSVGIEALSRGAAQATFVEKQARAITVIRENLRRTGLSSAARVVQADVFRFLEETARPFDLIYVAPPQYQGLWSKTLLTLEARPGWLGPEGLVVVQIFPKEWQPLDLATMVMVDKRRYGSTMLCFYELTEPDPTPE
jgi:16S rRNA (guanine(966)-N(2))-methyltransferase RsmD